MTAASRMVLAGGYSDRNRADQYSYSSVEIEDAYSIHGKIGDPFDEPDFDAGGGGGGGGKTPDQQDLDRREREIADREANLRSREAAMDGVTPNNWPLAKYAIDYHDIAGDIPEEHKRFCKRAYHMYFGVVGALWMSSLYSLCQVALIHCVIWTVSAVAAMYLAWFGWYKSLYGILKDSTRFGWIKFWFWFALHMLVVVLGGAIGVWNLVANILTFNLFWVLMTGTTVLLWAYVAIFSLAVLKGAQAMYAGRDIRDDIKNESNMRVISNVVRGVMSN
eukprot:202772_1